MFQARSEWRHIRLIFDHAEGPLIRFAYSLSWVLCSNYHNCCAKHACLYGCRLDVSVRGERGIPAPNPINAGWMAGPAEGEGGYRGRGRRRRRRAGGRDAGPTHSQWHSPGQHARLQPPGAPQERLCTSCNPPTTHTRTILSRATSSGWLEENQICNGNMTVSPYVCLYRSSELADTQQVPRHSHSFVPLILSDLEKIFFKIMLRSQVCEIHKGDVLQVSAWISNSMWCSSFI